jgi:hypothetical protein
MNIWTITHVNGLVSPVHEEKDSMVKGTMVELFPTKREHCGNMWFLLAFTVSYLNS